MLIWPAAQYLTTSKDVTQKGEAFGYEEAGWFAANDLLWFGALRGFQIPVSLTV